MHGPRLSGVITAIPTPLLENEDLDLPALKKIIDHVIAGGADGIFVLGNMGEGPALLDDQKALAVEKSVEHVAGRVPLLAGMAEVSPRRMIALGRRLKKAGPDCLVMTTPFYYSFPHPESLCEAAGRVTGELDFPTVFYHCPGATGNRVPLEALLRIMALPRVVALKDSSCDFRLLASILRARAGDGPRSCAILQGDESVYDVSLLCGADGIVTGGGTAFVGLLAELLEAARAGDRARAFELQGKFSAAMAGMLGPELPIDWMYAVKRELARKGLCRPNVTSPFLKREERFRPDGRQERAS